mmetsp:Transcript_17221/g.45292  ORF Transcript_17221/g.45292 Transcript_17221/m.45292 type:complete len:219 (-) Transcript_17221:23-679(-)
MERRGPRRPDSGAAVEQRAGRPHLSGRAPLPARDHRAAAQGAGGDAAGLPDGGNGPAADAGALPLVEAVVALHIWGRRVVGRVALEPLHLRPGGLQPDVDRARSRIRRYIHAGRADDAPSARCALRVLRRGPPQVLQVRDGADGDSGHAAGRCEAVSAPHRRQGVGHQPPAAGGGVLLPAPLSGVPDQGHAHGQAADGHPRNRRLRPEMSRSRVRAVR